MSNLPPTMRTVMEAWADEFTNSVWLRFRVLAFAAILCVGRHTILR